jgi:hypothetical protein
MTYRNRSLARKPVAMLRANEEEKGDLDFIVDYFNGEEPAVAYRLALQEFARMKKHERNSLSPARLDMGSWGHLMAA